MEISNSLKSAAKTALFDCLGLKKNEKLLIVTDTNKCIIGKAMFLEALNNGIESLYTEIKPGEINGEEPPPYIAALMKEFDVTVCPTSKSLTHTSARREACAAGARIATFPGITEEIMIRGMNADYNFIENLTMKIKAQMEQTSVVRIVTDAGTDISLNISGRKIIPSHGRFRNKGEGGNLPTGEAYCAPIEGLSDGVFVVDGSMAGVGITIDENIRIEVKNGLVSNISGGAKAEKLKKMIEPYGEKGRNIAEFGIGTNPSARLSGVVLEDEKVLGTVHIALGDNVTMGGKISVPIHLDGVIRFPNVYFDGKIIIEKGSLLI